CSICRRLVAGPEQQNHMGGHILRKIRDVAEPDLIKTVSNEFPCGFCGQYTKGTCILSIAAGKAQSTCSQAYNFRISAASKIFKSKPCTNVPIQCPFC
ncbi:hypothetical protein CPB83DRAFT_745856, partial [Crepidotus variabilis]